MSNVKTTEIYRVLASVLCLQLFKLEEIVVHTELPLTTVDQAVKLYRSYFLRKGPVFYVRQNKLNKLRSELQKLYDDIPVDDKKPGPNLDRLDRLLSQASDLIRQVSLQEDIRDRKTLTVAVSHILQGIFVRLSPSLNKEELSPEISERYGKFLKQKKLFRSVMAQVYAPSVLRSPANQQIELSAPLVPIRGILSYRSEINFRFHHVSSAVCLGQDKHLSQVVRLFLRPRQPTLVFLVGDAGIGKSTIAKAVAKTVIQHRQRLYLPQNVQVLDCVGISSFDQLSRLFCSQIYTQVSSPIPERDEDRLNLLGHKLASQKHFWILDGMDEYFLSNPENDAMLEIFRDLVNRASTLDILVTMRTEISTRQTKMLRKHASFRRTLATHSVQSWDLPSQMESLGPNPTLRQIERHPLAYLLVKAAFSSPEHSLPHGLPEDSPPPQILQYAFNICWQALTPRDQTILQSMSLLPGGVWFANDISNDLDPIGWQDIFKLDSDWRESLFNLRNLEWLESKEDHSDVLGVTYLFNLRPALSELVSQTLPKSQLNSKTEQLVWFWFKRLRRWSKILVTRLTNNIQVVCRFLHGAKNAGFNSEEHARYLIDVTRQNWSLAFRSICSSANRRNIYTLYRGFLQGTICYSRMIAANRDFLDMVEHALDSLPLNSEISGPLSSARTLYNKVCLASYHGMKGRTHRRLGEWDLALDGLNKAVALLTPHSSENYASLQHELAWALTERGRICHATGNWDEAERNLVAAVQIREKLVHLPEEAILDELSTPTTLQEVSSQFPRMCGYLASSLAMLGRLFNETMDWSKSEPLLKRALSIRSRLSTINPYYFRPYEARCLSDYANSLYYQNRLDEAMEYYQRALSLRTEVSMNARNVNSEDIARLHNNIGNVLRRQGYYQQAQSFLQSAVSIYQACVDECPSRYNALLATSLCNLARAMYHQGDKSTDALGLLQESINMHSASSEQKTHFRWIEACIFLAQSYMDFHLHEEAGASLENADKLLTQLGNVCKKNRCYYEAFVLSAKAKLELARAPSEDSWLKAKAYLDDARQFKEALARMSNISSFNELQLAENDFEYGVLFKRGHSRLALSYFSRVLDRETSLLMNQRAFAKRLLGMAATHAASIHRLLDQEWECDRLIDKANDIFTTLDVMSPGSYAAEFHALSHIKAEGPPKQSKSKRRAVAH